MFNKTFAIAACIATAGLLTANTVAARELGERPRQEDRRADRQADRQADRRVDRVLEVRSASARDDKGGLVPRDNRVEAGDDRRPR